MEPRIPDPRALATPLDDEGALALSDLAGSDLGPLFEAAARVRDAAWGRTITFSPKVFLPLTNLCRNRCDYCSFRRSPGDPGEWTMSPEEVDAWVQRGRREGCVEALFCLGDKPEKAFSAYRRTLAAMGQPSTVAHLHASARRALACGLLPHTNAGLLEPEEMRSLKQVNVSLGLMLEHATARLCEPGMPHHKAPDKRPEKRIAMIEAAGALRIPFTTGILVGIGETRRERVESLLAIRDLHAKYGHVQEVIVQNFRTRPEIPMGGAPDPEAAEIAHAVALARLVLPTEITVQAPPNLNPATLGDLVRAGINDLGGISPVTPDYINPHHPWPHLGGLAAELRGLGFELAPRLPIHDAWIDRPGFLNPGLVAPLQAARERMRSTTYASPPPADHRRAQESFA